MTVYAMKPILALLLIAFSAAAQVPPLPPEPAPKGHKSMADAENDAVRLRAAKTRQATNTTTVSASFNYPPQIDLRNQPAVQRVRDEVARQKLQPVKPAKMTKHPGLKPPTRSPRDK